MTTWLIGNDQQIFIWVARRIGVEFIRESFRGLGVLRDGELIAGLVLSQYTGFDVRLSAAATRRDWLSRGLISDVAKFVFTELKCKRVTVVCRRQNKSTRALSLRLGFREEGVLRKAWDGIDDAVFYGMLEEDCKWRLIRD